MLGVSAALRVAGLQRVANTDIIEPQLSQPLAQAEPEAKSQKRWSRTHQQLPCPAGSKNAASEQASVAISMIVMAYNLFVWHGKDNVQRSATPAS